VQEVAEVADGAVGRPERGPAGLQVDVYGLARNGRGPKQAAVGDARVVVVELMIEVNLTVEEVQSDEAESALVAAAIDPHVFPLHEAHVGLKGQVHFLAGVRIPADAGAEDAHIPDIAVEVGDLRRLVAGRGRVVVDREILAPDRDRHATGKGLRGDAVPGPGLPPKTAPATPAPVRKN
jgi:hypothetical protein